MSIIEISTFKYFVLDTGYTSRLHEQIEEINETIFDCMRLDGINSMQLVNNILIIHLDTESG